LKILLTGRNGQVGWELERTLPALGEVVATDRSTLDLALPDSIRHAVREAKPDLIVNAAAYTAVDKAESEPELAMRINGEAPGVLAEEAKRLGALLVHYSTDYVFDGEKASPYVETDPLNPLSAYGRSKQAGEQAVRAAGGDHLTLRTSWVYAGRGRNFLLTMLRLAREGKPLRVVADQHGAPTSSRMLAAATTQAIPKLLADRSLGGLYHMTAAGSTTWHGFAVAAFRQAGLSANPAAIRTDEYPTPARRPRNSLLDNSKLAARLGLRLPDWEQGLREVLR
jgi:dTDP-4-dehydrorhamnose reductase